MFPALFKSVFFVFLVATHKSLRMKFSDFTVPYKYMKMSSGDAGTIIWYQGKDVPVRHHAMATYGVEAELHHS
jgi:hypothetical protein